MKKTIRKRSIDTVFVLIIFSAFALSVLLVLSLGAGVYRNISDITGEREAERTVLSYVRTKVRNLDNAGAVSVVTYSGIAALEIRENIGEREFRTVIYNHDGWLYEMFSDINSEFPLSEGLPIAPNDDLNFTTLDNGLIRVSSGDMYLHISPRSSKTAMRGGADG